MRGRVDCRVTRFVVDCGAVLRLASKGIEVPAEHELLAPTPLRSQTLSAQLHSKHPSDCFCETVVPLEDAMVVAKIRKADKEGANYGRATLQGEHP
jgi:hypothetical protein